jgi:hypothetical protein
MRFIVLRLVFLTLAVAVWNMDWGAGWGAWVHTAVVFGVGTAYGLCSAHSLEWCPDGSTLVLVDQPPAEGE